MITVHKRDHTGRVKLSYAGETLERGDTWVLLAARFELGPMPLDYVTLNTGDTFVEYFYSDRWYNIFAIFDAEGGGFKGWYCNVTRPAALNGAEVWADDLALDLFVEPDGREWVLDEDEFAALALTSEEQAQARAALSQLQALARSRQGPFSPATLERLKELSSGIRPSQPS